MDRKPIGGGNSCRGQLIYSLPFCLVFFWATLGSYAQEPEKRGLLDRVSGQISVTNNGISLVPAFSLNDPALLVNLQFVRGGFSVEPDIRFGLDGKPWSFLFWLRYRPVQKERFTLRVGRGPSRV